MKKQNKRNQFTRITLALLLILSMLGNALILPATAQEALTPTDEAALPETPLDGTNDMTGVPTLPEPIQLTAADIPEFISAAALEERGAVERMRSEETNMSSVIFRNADGTRTMYMYGLPVKYTAMDGTVRDKSTNLVSVSTAAVLLADRPVAETVVQMSSAQQTALQAELGILDAERAADTLHMLSTALTAQGKSLSDMAYATLDNDVYALFPTNLTQGMTLVFGSHSVRMTPATGMTMTTGSDVTKTTAASLTDTDITERLLYPNVFGPGTAVQYTPTLTGVKEEILLARNVGKNSFDFLLETGGLVLIEQNGQFTLIDPETEQTVGTLGEIIVFDSAGQIVRGNMTAQTIKDGQIYGITISVDQEFLASATYPVSIDPTMDTIHPIEEPIIDQPKVMIEDVSIYSDANAVNYTFIEWHQIGDVISTGYRGQAAFRFPVLYDPSIGTDHYLLKAEDISSFVLHLKSTGNTTTSNVLRASPYVPEWPENAYGHEQKLFGQLYYWYSYISDWDAEVINVPSNATFSIDLTGFAKTWKDMQHGIITDPNDGRPETGVLLWNFEDEGNIWIESAEHSTAMHVTMDYALPGIITGTVYINNMDTRTFLAKESNDEIVLKGGTVSKIGDQIAWDIVYRGQEMYSLHPNGNMNLYLDDFAEIMPGSISYYGCWNISISNVGGVTFTNCYSGKVLAVNDIGIVETLSDDNVTECKKAWRVVSADDYKELQSVSTISDEIWLAPQESYDVWDNLYLNDWHFVSAEDFECTPWSTTVVTSAGNLITGEDPDGWATIYVKHIPTGLTAPMYVYTTSLAEGNYFLRNSLLGKYAQIAEGEAPEYATHGAAIEAWDFDSGAHQEWILTRQYRNYYSIVSAKSGQALTVQIEDVNADGNALAQEINYGFYRQLWTFERTSNGTYVIRPRSAEQYTTDWCMSADDSSTNGTNIVQTAYNSTDGNSADEWYALQPDLYIYVLYDNAYASKYSNRIDDIAGDMTVVHEKLWTEFGFFVAYSEATLFTSLADECTGGTCECGPGVNSSHPAHHKNVYNVLYNLPEPQSKRYGVLAYIGHELCMNDEEGGHVSSGYLGMASYSVNKAIVMNPESDAQVLRTTLHEIGHWLQAPDHYGTNGEPSTDDINYGIEGHPFNRDCIYGEDRHQHPAQTNLIICQGCKNEMSEYIEEEYSNDGYE